MHKQGTSFICSFVTELKGKNSKCLLHSFRNKSFPKISGFPRTGYILLTPALFQIFHCTNVKFFIKDFFSRCDQIPRNQRIWSDLLKKSFMENFIVCTVFITTFRYYKAPWKQFRQRYFCCIKNVDEKIKQKWMYKNYLQIDKSINK